MFDPSHEPGRLMTIPASSASMTSSLSTVSGPCVVAPSRSASIPVHSLTSPAYSAAVFSVISMVTFMCPLAPGMNGESAWPQDQAAAMSVLEKSSPLNSRGER